MNNYNRLQSESNITFIQNGNIFLTEKQTLTVPVNLVGIMGAGLALSTKKLYPDVYEEYRDLCKKRRILQGTPYLLKYHYNRWFLLFPTKRHYQQRSKMEDLSDGLTWILEHAKDLNMNSIAFPALGCGLGGLDWKEVKPLMIEKLKSFEGKIEIYEPY